MSPSVIPMSDPQVLYHPRSDGAIHAFFGLTYASYLVLHRSLLQSMPHKWQELFVELVEQLQAAHQEAERRGAAPPVPADYTVLTRDVQGRFVSDPVRQYRHNHYALCPHIHDEEILVFPEEQSNDG